MPYSGSPERLRRPYRPHHPAAHVPDRLDGQLHHVEQVHGEDRARQHPANRRGVDAAQVDAHRLDGIPPRRRGAGQPVRGVIGGAALHLAQQPLLSGQVEEAGVPPVSEQDVLPGLLIGGEAHPAAAVLIDAQVRHRRRGLLDHRVRGGGERLMRRRPGDPGMPRRLGRGDPPLSDLIRGLLPQPGRDPAPWRQGRHPLGERLPRALRVAALPPELGPSQVHRIGGAAHVPRPGHHRFMHPVRDRAAIRARPSPKFPRMKPSTRRLPAETCGDLMLS
jgi:hypothetical protein